jgi:dienelactone hydrolase
MRVEAIGYSDGTRAFRGALIYDETVARARPAVLVAPNWMGVTDAAIERGRFLAGDRYAVLVVDMYGAGVRPRDFGEAAALAGPLRNDPQEIRRRMQAACDALVREAGSRGLIDDKRAAIGFCFGGGNVLELARAGADLHAVVSVHGDLVTEAPAQRGSVKAALLVLHGSADPVAPRAHRERFEDEMNEAGAKWQLLTFSGVLHAFTNEDANLPGISKYHEPTARQSYTHMHAFLADAFAGRL